MKSVVVLGIESSCDETGVALIRDGDLIGHRLATQSDHSIYGGVVPELASRAHERNVVPLVNALLTQTNVPKSGLDAVAFTQGPGLLGSLLVGGSFAKGFAQALELPLVPVHHMRAHVLAHFLADPKPTFPFLCLTVSGGHTQLVVVKSFLEMEVVGQTRDDAVGEAFDKAAKLLGLPYPGGIEIDKLARQGDASRFSFPLYQMPELDYSFSGIKTAILYFLRDQLTADKDFVEKNLADLCASIQGALVDLLLTKLIQASEQFGLTSIAIAGGVAANTGLRTRLQQEAQTRGWELFVPDLMYCTDNAAMIALTGYHYFRAGQVADLSVSPSPRLPFS